MLEHTAALVLAATRHVIVRTELVHGSDGGFDWLDAAAGFGFAVVSAGVVLLVGGAVRGRRSRSRSAKSAS
jgi:ABC-type tungstate transport system substrate-binding protein